MLTDSEVIAALLARLGGTVDLGRRELEAASGWRIMAVKNPVTGQTTLQLRARTDG